MAKRRLFVGISIILLLTSASAATVCFLAGWHLTPQQRVARVIESARNQDRAVVFVRFDWTFQDTQRDFFKQFEARYSQTPNAPSVSFYVGDFSSVGDYKPLSEMSGWTDFEPSPDQSPIDGDGQMFWMQNGAIVANFDVSDFASPNDAVNKTIEIFTPSN